MQRDGNHNPFKKGVGKPTKRVKMACYMPQLEAEKLMRFGVELCKRPYNEKNIRLGYKPCGLLLCVR